MIHDGDPCPRHHTPGKLEARRARADRQTLCRSGFHPWQLLTDRRFDVKAGKLLTAEVCSRCCGETDPPHVTAALRRIDLYPGRGGSLSRREPSSAVRRKSLGCTSPASAAVTAASSPSTPSGAPMPALPRHRSPRAATRPQRQRGPRAADRHRPRPRPRHPHRHPRRRHHHARPRLRPRCANASSRPSSPTPASTLRTSKGAVKTGYRDVRDLIVAVGTPRAKRRPVDLLHLRRPETNRRGQGPPGQPHESQLRPPRPKDRHRQSDTGLTEVRLRPQPPTSSARSPPTAAPRTRP